MSSLKIALTGGIACGKSSVAQIFKQFGVTVIELDKIAKSVAKSGTKELHGLISHFGSVILNADKSLNRDALRTLLLQSKTNQALIESILHPPIFARMHAEIGQCKDRLIVIEIPMISKQNLGNFDRVIVVECNQQKQLARLIKRENISEKAAKNRLAAQIGQKQRLNIVQQVPVDVLENNADIDYLNKKTQSLYKKLIEIAKDREG